MKFLIFGLIILIALLFLGMPVVYSFCVSVLVMITGLGFDLSFIMSTAYSRIASYTLVCVPLFTLAGGIIAKGDMGDKLINFINLFVGKFKCSLAYISSISCAIFGALTGSASATIASIGSILAPQMKAANYPDGFIGALFANVSMLALLIPPSSVMIVSAWSSGLSVLTCFMTTLVPGILLSLAFCILSAFLMRNNKDIKYEYVPRKPAEWGRHALVTTKEAIGILLLPVVILGGIYGGFMTATESAAVGALYAIIAAMLIYRKAKAKDIYSALTGSATTAGVIMVSMLMAGVVSKVLTYAGLPEWISSFISGFTSSKNVVLVIFNIVFILLGMIMDETSSVLITLPLFMPLAKEMGINPYHFVAIMNVTLGMGAVTPPAAPSLYTSVRICDVDLAGMLKYNLYFCVFGWLPIIILTTYIPELSLFVPRLMGLI